MDHEDLAGRAGIASRALPGDRIPTVVKDNRGIKDSRDSRETKGSRGIKDRAAVKTRAAS